jgi:hypothetical protein
VDTSDQPPNIKKLNTMISGVNTGDLTEKIPVKKEPSP